MRKLFTIAVVVYTWFCVIGMTVLIGQCALNPESVCKVSWNDKPKDDQ